MDTRGMSSVQRIEMLKRTLRSVNIDIDWCEERIRQRMVEKEVIERKIEGMKKFIGVSEPHL